MSNQYYDPSYNTSTTTNTTAAVNITSSSSSSLPASAIVSNPTQTNNPYHNSTYATSSSGSSSVLPVPAYPANVNALHARAAAVVNDATQPGVTDSIAEQKRIWLIRFVLKERGGEAVAFSLRKKLKSFNEVEVLNTLTLLDELMRTCPLFFRHIANEKFFRRLWRFINPNYKTNVFSGSSNSIFAGNSTIASRILILIRAWAEELSRMFKGRFEPAAAFLIERYNNKRVKVRFPPVPKSKLPWVCPLDGPPPSNDGLPDHWPVQEVENTAELFESMMDSTASVDELTNDVFTELVSRCRLISNNLDRIMVNPEIPGDADRARKVGDRINRVLKRYDEAMKTGILENSAYIPVVEISSDEEHDRGDGTYEAYAIGPHFDQRDPGYDYDDYYEREQEEARYAAEEAAAAAAAYNYEMDRREMERQEMERQEEEKRIKKEKKEKKKQKEKIKEKEKERERKEKLLVDAPEVSDQSPEESSEEEEKNSSKKDKKKISKKKLQAELEVMPSISVHPHMSTVPPISMRPQMSAAPSQHPQASMDPLAMMINRAQSGQLASAAQYQSIAMGQNPVAVYHSLAMNQPTISQQQMMGNYQSVNPTLVQAFQSINPNGGMSQQQFQQALAAFQSVAPNQGNHPLTQQQMNQALAAFQSVNPNSQQMTKQEVNPAALAAFQSINPDTTQSIRQNPVNQQQQKQAHPYQSVRHNPNQIQQQNNQNLYQSMRQNQNQNLYSAMSQNQNQNPYMSVNYGTSNPYQSMRGQAQGQVPHNLQQQQQQQMLMKQRQQQIQTGGYSQAQQNQMQGGFDPLAAFQSTSHASVRSQQQPPNFKGIPEIDATSVQVMMNNPNLLAAYQSQSLEQQQKFQQSLRHNLNDNPQPPNNNMDPLLAAFQSINVGGSDNYQGQGGISVKGKRQTSEARNSDSIVALQSTQMAPHVVTNNTVPLEKVSTGAASNENSENPAASDDNNPFA